jgi:hypothetical protein
MDGGDDGLTVPKDGLEVFLHWRRQAHQLIDAVSPRSMAPRFQVPSHPPGGSLPATSSIEEDDGRQHRQTDDYPRDHPHIPSPFRRIGHRSRFEASRRIQYISRLTWPQAVFLSSGEE